MPLRDATCCLMLPAWILSWSRCWIAARLRCYWRWWWWRFHLIVILASGGGCCSFFPMDVTMGKRRQGVASCSICALSTSRGAPSLSWHRSRRGSRCWSLWPFPFPRAATVFSVMQSSFLGVIHIFQVAWGPMHCGRLPRVLLWPAQPAVGRGDRGDRDTKTAKNCHRSRHTPPDPLRSQ